MWHLHFDFTPFPDDMSEINISSSHVIRNVQPQNDGNTRIFQTLMLGRHVSHEVKDLHFREMQENPHDIECLCKDDKTNHKGMPTIHKNHLRDRRDQPSRKDERTKPVDNWLAVSCCNELSVFQTEGKIHECNEVKSLTSISSFSPLQRIRPTRAGGLNHSRVPSTASSLLQCGTQQRVGERRIGVEIRLLGVKFPIPPRGAFAFHILVCMSLTQKIQKSGSVNF
ncbi:hypothetical protein MC885_020156 [Smutsia gigantea]|nr:hypothetical protein MC885_020156 [Smutsia gigantea]